MEGKVTLFDANGVEIGETYTRRARQLVKHQRAIWMDDTHTAIQFMQDSPEGWERSIEPEPILATTPAPASPPDKDSALYTIAEKCIRDRRRFIVHTLFLIPGYFCILILWMIITNARMHNMSFLTMGFAWGCWTMTYIFHLRAYRKSYRYGAGDFATRRRLKLQAEVDRLKRMGYTE